jgi:DNA-binding NarL/FixJ family response regulator
MRKVIIADDHPMIRGALTLAVASAFGRVEIVECSNLSELLEQLTEGGDADLVLLDLKMPGTHGFEGLLTIRSNFPATPIVIISALEEPRLVLEALTLGTAGFIPKSTPRAELVAALQLVAAGGIYSPPHLSADADGTSQWTESDTEFARRASTLTPQQRRVLQLLGTGKLNKEIAFELDIAETTVKAHVSSILHKFKVYSRTQAVVMAQRLHLDTFGEIQET